MISIDNREKSRIPELLKKLGVPTETKQLSIGDYCIFGPTTSACISLKSVGDYLGSINSSHLNDELYQLSSAYDYSVFVVYGNLSEELLYRKIRRETYFQYLAGCIVHRSPEGKQGSVSVVNFDTDFDVAMFLKTMHNLISTDDIYREPSVQKVKVTEENRALLNISRLPKVGPIRAKSLLEHFKTVRAIYNATPEQLVEVEGVGSVIAEHIVKFINKEYTKNI